MDKLKNLTSQQELFVQEYLVDFNAAGAALRAGYKTKYPEKVGYELLNKPHVKAQVRLEMDQRKDEIRYSIERVLHGLSDIAFADIGEAFNNKGELLPMSEIPRHVRLAISSVESLEQFEGAGRERIYIGDLKKVRFWDKTRSLELLGKYHKLFVDKLEIEDKTDLAKKLQQARSRISSSADSSKEE